MTVQVNITRDDSSDGKVSIVRSDNGNETVIEPDLDNGQTVSAQVWKGSELIIREVDSEAETGSG